MNLNLNFSLNLSLSLNIKSETDIEFKFFTSKMQLKRHLNDFKANSNLTRKFYFNLLT